MWLINELKIRTVLNKYSTGLNFTVLVLFSAVYIRCVIRLFSVSLAAAAAAERPFIKTNEV